MRKFYYSIPAILLVVLTVAAWHFREQVPARTKYTKGERIQGAIEDRIFTSSDIDLGHIPEDKLQLAIREGQKRVARAKLNRSQGGSLSSAVWRERGPYNIGGRTRAILVDESDPNRNRIWIGGVSGGIWRTEDITQQDPQWTKIGTHFSTTSIGDIAQDPNDHRTIYVGTGESYTGDFQGVGIYKSTDDGASWTLLPSTENSNFDYVNEILVDKNSYVLAATSVGGLLRSKDGGMTWEKVLGTSLSGASSNDFHDLVYSEVNQTYYASNDNSVFSSTTGDRGDWTSIGTGKPGFPTNLLRCEFALCASDPNVMYVLGAVPGENPWSASKTYVSNNGGATWVARSEPGEVPGTDFTNGQAWYDLEIAADPQNCGRILAGGVGMMESDFQAISWNSIGGGQIHVDHHYIVFDHKKPGRVFYGNDGGVFMSNNSGQTILNKNIGYVTTQFYCGAIHPEAGSPYIIGGTQDNNSLQITEPGLASANSVWGGDGVFCFIDQDDPSIQIVSSQYGNYGLSTDGGADFGFGAEIANAAFINRSGYDDRANILYGQIGNGGFFRWNVITGQTDYVDISGGLNLDVSAVKADPAVPNRMYFGGSSGRIVRVDNAHEGTTVSGTLIADFPSGASISCVYMDSLTSDHIIASLFNYGASLENVWVTYNAGTEWTPIEGDLPDIPVRWVIFDPSDHDKAMIATDAGIWTTDDINGDQTHWEPANPDNGMPFVRVDMLLMRASDKVVLAATHGRGLMTTDVFSAAAPVILAQPIAYEGQSFVIDGSQSVNAQSFVWDLGDNTTSTNETIVHTYNEPGTYTITLTINGSVSDTRTVSVLPYLSAPYQEGSPEYAGDFESNTAHFAPYTVSGTGFQLGSSNKPGKDGTHSGNNAWVLGKDVNAYENNTYAELYTPMYDLSDQGLFTLKFWTKYAVQFRNDGFQVEYSTDGGASWNQLGTRDDPNWYNYHNSQLADGAFPIGKAYFTNAQLNWVQYTKDVSFLVGEPRVAFRFVFRSDDEEPAQGLAIDDVEVTRYDGELRTMITAFSGSYTGEQEVTVNWTTGIEYHAKQFILERSYTGFGFTEVQQVNAKGVVSSFAQNYQWEDQSLRNVIYYRLKVINDNPDLNYHLEFYSDTIVVRRDAEPDLVNHVLTNPFADRILVSFSSVMNQEVSLRLFDLAGRLVRSERKVPNSVSTELNHLDLPPGIYVLSVQIGENDPTSYKLFTNGG